MKKFVSALLAAVLAVTPALLSSCSESDPVKELLKRATVISLEGSTASCESETVYVAADGKITITRAGTYSIEGTLDDGQIYVDCVDSGNVDIVLNNASINNSDGAAIVIKKATGATLTILDGTVNTLSDGSSYTFENAGDDEPDAVVFSKEDLIINGEGKLIVDANYAGAIYSKDGLTIESGEFELDSTAHAIKGKDYLVINGGKFNIHALGDGIKSTNTETELVGYLTINGGELNIYSEDEGIQAVSAININGGTVSIQSTNNGIKCGGKIYFNSGSVAIDAQDNALDAADVAHESDCSVTINGSPYIG